MNATPKVFAGPRERTDEVSERELAELYEQVGRLMVERDFLLRRSAPEPFDKDVIGKAYEEVYLKAYENAAEAGQGITAYFDFYNYQRLHQALAYRTLPGLRRINATCQFGAGENAGACPTRSAQ